MEYVKAVKHFRFSSIRGVRNNDFFSDRLCHRHTTKLLVLFLVLATFKRFFQSPINCWIPAELKRYDKFMTQYCWLKGTYYVHQSYDLNTLTIEARNETLLHYYQWVYFFLIIQAFLFYFPRILWYFISHKILDYDLFNMVDAAIKYDSYSYNPSGILKYLAACIRNEHIYVPVDKKKIRSYVHSIIKDENEYENLKSKKKKSKDEEKQEAKQVSVKYDYDISSTKMFIRKLVNSYLTLTYITIKLIYLLIAIFQLLLMNMFLSNRRHSFYGFEVLHTILSGQADLVDRSDSKIFPRITICDVTTKEMGTDHHYSLQCVLSFNLFNERIYAFLWFWIFVILIPFLVADLFTWISRVFIFGRNYKYKFLKSRIQIFNQIKTDNDKFLLQMFSEYCMGNDSVFVLRLLETNSNAIVVADLLNKMWTEFKAEQTRL
jgi:hypothetical protein